MSVRLGVILTVMTGVGLLGSACRPTNEPGLQPRSWRQLNADSANTGFNRLNWLS